VRDPPSVAPKPDFELLCAIHLIIPSHVFPFCRYKSPPSYARAVTRTFRFRFRFSTIGRGYAALVVDLSRSCHTCHNRLHLRQTLPLRLRVLFCARLKPTIPISPLCCYCCLFPLSAVASASARPFVAGAGPRNENPRSWPGPMCFTALVIEICPPAGRPPLRATLSQRPCSPRRGRAGGPDPSKQQPASPHTASRPPCFGSRSQWVPAARSNAPPADFFLLFAV